jgi:HSP20 family protein
VGDDDFPNRVDRFHWEVERYVYGLFNPHRPIHLLAEWRWRPPTDVYETGEAVVVKVELPGMSQAEISVEVEGKTLRVRGVRQPDGESGGTYHQMEINYGEFERTLILPDLLGENNVRARYHEGFLYITISKGPSRT